MRPTKSITAIALFTSTLVTATTTMAADNTTDYVPAYSPYVEQDIADEVLFGDTHVHTSYSPDAGMLGNKLGPAEAFKFAKGETVNASLGQKARLKKPLDWMVIADHAEGLGITPMIISSDPLIMGNEFGRKLHDLFNQGTTESLGKAWNLWAGARMEGKNPYSSDPEFPIKPWEEIIDAAEAANDPGKFSSLIGFEWSSTPDGNNLHRVVIFRDGKDVANQRIPLSSDISVEPESLWDWMESFMEESGGQMLAIPHNGNVSNGWMFSEKRYSDGSAVDKEYAQRRQKLEPLYEVTQMKGDSETHPLLSPDDEYADFESWDRGSMGAGEKTDDMLPREYARAGLKRGLVLKDQWGANPYKFGLIGSSDTHTSLSTTREENFFGKVTPLEPAPSHERMNEVVAGRLGNESTFMYARETSASGLAAVWAKENTREEVYDALARKEVYATTGTRLKVRVFAGFDFDESDLYRPDFAVNGYAKGVPMGGDLNAAPEGSALTLLVKALRDPDGANLDRIQIIKGWLDDDGNTHEQVYDVACSDGRKITRKHQCNKDVGSTVNVEKATYSNSIGAPILEAYWQDPNFNPDQRAFYYVRVLEIPTPRWTTYDAKTFGIRRPEDVPAAIQDRAYTSPVWYAPSGKAGES